MMKRILMMILVLCALGYSININACQNLSSSGIYDATSDLNSTDYTCINVTSNNIELNCHGFSINGAVGNHRDGIYMNSMTNFTVKNCVILGFYYGMDMLSSIGINMSNVNTSSFVSSGRAAYFSASSNINMSNCNFTASGFPGSVGALQFDNSHDINMSNNLLFSQDSFPFIFSSGSSLSSSFFSTNDRYIAVGNWYSIYILSASSGLAFENSTLSSNNAVSVYINTNSNANNLSIKRSVFSSSSQGIISTTGTSNIVFEGNLMNTTSDAVNFFSKDSVFKNNTIISQDKGIHFQSTASNNTVFWNNFTCTNAYISDENGNNFYNSSQGGQNEGNIYSNVVNGSVNLTGASSSLGIPGYFVATSGSGYPYNNTTSFGKFSCNFNGCADYAPLILAREFSVVLNGSIVNSTTSHSFLITSGVKNNFSSIISTNCSATLGNCVYVSNSTDGIFFNSTYNFSSTMEGNVNISIGFTDATGAYVQSFSQNSYPANPHLTKPSLNPTNFTVIGIINCTNGSFSGAPSDIENTTNRTWAWFINGTISNQTTQQINLGILSVRKGSNVSCLETTSGQNWSSFQVSNMSSNISINNSAPVANTPTGIATFSDYIIVNCSATDADGGADIITVLNTPTSGSAVQIANASSGIDFWASFNITGLFSLENINDTCGFVDANGSAASSIAGFATTNGDSYGTETQYGYAYANQTILWTQTYTTTGVLHTCNYSPQKADYTNETAPYVLDSGSNLIASNANNTTITWPCSGALSPYTLAFYTNKIKLTYFSVAGSGLGNNAVEYELEPNTTTSVNLNFTFSYAEASANRKLWQCNLNNFVTCDAGNAILWTQLAFIENDTGTQVNGYKLVLSPLPANLVFVTTNDGVAPPAPPAPGGGGGSVTIYQNQSANYTYTPGKPPSYIPVLSDIDKILSPKTAAGFTNLDLSFLGMGVVRILNYWILSVIYGIYFLASLEHASSSGESTYLGGLDILLFMIWAVGLVNYWPPM